MDVQPAVPHLARSLLLFALSGCSNTASNFLPPEPPDPDLVAAVPADWSYAEDNAHCQALRLDVDRAIAAHAPSEAERALGEVLDRCPLAPGVHWRHGWIAHARGDDDTAVRAMSRELLVPDGERAAGAQLRAMLPHTRKSTQRAIARMGRTFDDGVYTTDQFSREFLIDLKCRGTPAALWSIGHYRSPVLSHRIVVSCRGRRFRIFTRP